MTKTEILFYGALLESDMYVDGYGSTDEDALQVQKALKKMYGVTKEISDEDALKTEAQINDDMRSLVIEFRDKVREYLGKEE